MAKTRSVRRNTDDRRQNLHGRQKKHSENSRGSWGKNFLNLGEGVEFYKMGAKNEFDILPWKVTTKNHPDKDVKPGDYEWVLDVSIHQNIGVNNDNYVCLKRTYGKPCPICEERERLAELNGWKDPIVTALSPSRRGLMWILDHRERDEDKEIKLFKSSWASLAKNGFMSLLLQEIEVTEGEENQEIIVADLEEGRTVTFEGMEASGGDFTYMTPNPRKFKLVPRDESLDEELWDRVPSLDALLIIPTYDELRNALHMVEEDDIDDIKKEEEERSPLRRRTKPEPEEDNPDDNKEDEDPEPEEEEEEKPVRTRRSKNKCPHDHEWGKDHDTTKECKKCDSWDECFDAADEVGNE